MIENGQGNLLMADVDALVNTVNTVGVMGKGIALQFKRAFPANYAVYRQACARGEVELGAMFVHDSARAGRQRYIINFPTKGHWRSMSRSADVQAGLVDLVRVVRDRHIRSIAVPALGCGNGGLDWADIRPMIVEAFEPLADVRVVLFAPDGAPAAEDMPVATPRPKLTPARAMLVVAVRRYFERSSALEPAQGVSELEIQKLLYFAKRMGEPVKLDFVRARYGPYAHALNRVLADLEGHHIVGFGDDSARVGDLARITVRESSFVEGLQQLPSGSSDRIDRILDLVDGFETPYGMELLATVDFAAHDGDASCDASILSQRVAAWNIRKARLFTDAHVQLAAARLRQKGMLPAM